MKTKLGTPAFFCIVALLSGCTPGDVPAPHAKEPAEEVDPGRPAQTAVPPSAQHALGRADTDIAATTSWDAEVRRMPKADAAYLQAIKERYFGAVAYENERERRQLEDAGFPSMEEWRQTRMMSDSELQRGAETGDGKAMAFYVDRMMERAAPYLHLRGADDAAYNASPGAGYVLKAYAYSTQVQFAHRSPFTGYLLGAVFSTLAYPQSPESAAAGMMAARDAGDPRAEALLAAYGARHPDMNQETVLAAHRAMKIPE
ncbi:MAG: hypothetical protein ACN6RH_18715 [Stenotrophomonas rhizophila]|uniref:hypothetical protein n=1 Tax=Stenotrophomonas rhizophila TaxID=216778 RepID=UPI003D11BE2A